ncbi:DNA-binding LacI/PurR family transcriptional regulator [Catalinimonas alkaloidigena]|uniref:LacI family DNA-binding transcriptional regulator n=1 Tax=Catalinimonas alkaloidigena TaxID=1075417 RepID=UPI002407264F|nr:LacI family DNA-binding transcriptional regulator [Catalinimonas alkaloidigena]MDF9799919.1 DNA-binding LacI/PurR family transcriptional regulator [Catalinimonas alkaloidigena]
MSKYQSTVDIARALKLSPSTVSRALNDHYSISEKTKLRVLAYAHEVGFRKNLNASRLIQRKTFTLGILMPEVVSHTFSTLAQGINDVLEPVGYDMLIMNASEQYKKEVHMLNYLASIRVDGIIFSPTQQTKDYAHLQSLLKNKIPFVNIDRGLTNVDCHQILLDDEEGAFQAVQHLVNLGCRSIAHIAGPPEALNSRNRIIGYRKALEAGGLAFDASLLTYSDFIIGNSMEAVRSLFERDNIPEGIFAVNDEIVLGCLQMAAQKGIQVPEQLALVGFDDEVYSRFFRPSISTVRSPIREMGQKAAQLCLNMIDDYESFPPKTQLLTPQLIIRSSSRKEWRKE